MVFQYVSANKLLVASRYTNGEVRSAEVGRVGTYAALSARESIAVDEAGIRYSGADLSGGNNEQSVVSYRAEEPLFILGRASCMLMERKACHYLHHFGRPSGPAAGQRQS